MYILKNMWGRRGEIINWNLGQKYFKVFHLIFQSAKNCGNEKRHYYSKTYAFEASQMSLFKMN